MLCIPESHSACPCRRDSDPRNNIADQEGIAASRQGGRDSTVSPVAQTAQFTAGAWGVGCQDLLLLGVGEPRTTLSSWDRSQSGRSWRSHDSRAATRQGTDGQGFSQGSGT